MGHQFVISSPSVRHQFVISSSSVRHQLVISSSSARHQFVIREKGKKEKRATLEMASEGPQRITEKYYGVYLPSYTIYPFAIDLSICHTTCNLSTVLIHL